MDNARYTPELLKRVQETELGILTDFIEVTRRHNIDYFLVFGSALGAMRHQGFIPWDDDIDVAILRKDYNKLVKIYQEEMADKYRFTNAELAEGQSSSVNHIELLGTKFLPEQGEEFDYVPGIYIDVFVYDHQAEGKIRSYIQYGTGWFLGRLLFLCGTGHPLIPFSGIMKRMAQMICVIIHEILKLLRIKPVTIYRLMEKNAQRYNKRKTRRITAFEPPKMWLNTMTKKELYPLKQVPFETITVNVPNRVDIHLTRVFGDYMEMPPEEKRWNHKPILIDFGDEGDKS